LVNFEAVKTHIDFNSAAAFEFLGPSGHNNNEQAQIQAVFANVATMHEAGGWYTPNWLRVGFTLCRIRVQANRISADSL